MSWQDSFAKIRSFATICPSMNMGQTRVAEIGREIGFYCFIFCETWAPSWFKPTATNPARFERLWR
jgi:hypothetical protein